MSDPHDVTRYTAEEFESIGAGIAANDTTYPVLQRLQAVIAKHLQIQPVTECAHPPPARHVAVRNGAGNVNNRSGNAGNAVYHVHHHHHYHYPSHERKRYQNSGGYRNQHNTRGDSRRPVVLSVETKTIRDLIGNLNKLNTANFTKISVQIQRTVSFDMDKCMPVLLDRCHLQCEYLPQYLQIFQQLQDTYPHTGTEIKNFIDGFVSDFICDQAYLRLGQICSPTEDYESYCAWNKQKTTIIRKHRAIIGMMTSGLTDTNDIHTYFGSLIQALYGVCDDTVDRGDRTFAVNEVLELLLDMLAEFFKIDEDGMDVKRYRRDWYDALQNVYRDMGFASKDARYTLKSRFKLEDILNAKWLPKAG